jgi:hypothetical protein
MNIASYMTNTIINSIKSSILLSCAAIYTRLQDEIQNFFRCQITFIGSLIRLAQKRSTSSLGLSPPFHTFLTQYALFWSQGTPSFFTSITSFFTFLMTFTTFVRKTKGTTFVAQENVSVCRKLAVASIADTMARLCSGSVVSRHVSLLVGAMLAHMDGPHFELARTIYPDPA